VLRFEELGEEMKNDALTKRTFLLMLSRFHVRETVAFRLWHNIDTPIRFGHLFEMLGEKLSATRCRTLPN
jgi:hypothetical protein